MSVMKRGKGRLTVILAFSALVLSQGGSFGGGGRAVNDCFRTCNDTRKACKSNCDADCEALHPNNDQAFNACRDVCREACDTGREDCELICEVLKDNPSPEAP